MESIPGWIGPTIAIALVAIALAVVVFVIGVLFATRRAAAEAAALSAEIRELRADLAPTIKAVSRLADNGTELAAKVQSELAAVLRLSRRIRRKVSRGARTVEHRLEDMDELYQLVSGEVEDTALDVAAKLRMLRSGAGALDRIKRMLVRWRR